jgi:hypothetical protein
MSNTEDHRWNLSEDEDVDQGIIVHVQEKRQAGRVPLCDLKVKPKADPNFCPVREYVV